MKKTSVGYLPIVMCLISTSAFSHDDHVDTVVNVGSETGYAAFATGKTVVAIHQGNCNYSMVLLENQYVKFNTPDVVFLESAAKPEDRNWPYLTQEETPAGYDWRFKKNNDLKSKWFGLMCEGAANFDLRDPGENVNSEETSPALQDVRQANDLKCPATLTEKGWVPNKSAGRPEEYVFQQLTGAKGAGFIFGFKNKERNRIARINFCLVQGDNILTGVAENQPKSLLIDQKIFDEIKTTLDTVRFLQ